MISTYRDLVDLVLKNGPLHCGEKVTIHKPAGWVRFFPLFDEMGVMVGHLDNNLMGTKHVEWANARVAQRWYTLFDMPRSFIYRRPPWSSV